MTLILTEITENGIAMAADSFVTYPSRGRAYPSAKLFNISYLNAGASTWGRTPEGHQSPDKWIKTQIEDMDGDCESVEDFSKEIESRAVSDFGALILNRGRYSDKPRASLGFHIAGYDDSERQFFNINNNPSVGTPEILDGDKASVKLEDYRDKASTEPKSGRGWLIHNGDWEGFRIFFDTFKIFRMRVSDPSDPLALPASGEIEDHGIWLGLLIQFISGVYQLSNMTEITPSTIGGDIHVILLTPDGGGDKIRQTLDMGGQGLRLVE